jgi:hypothetical protein
MSELQPLQEAPLTAVEPVAGASAPGLAFRATLLDERAYRVVAADADPFRRGGMALLFAVGMAALARLIGVALGVLTLPRIGVVQEQIFNAILKTPYYTQLAAASPDFASQFRMAYAGLWEVISLLGGYPSYAGLASALTSLLLLLGSWLVYATAVHWIARWFGAVVPYRRVLGVMALAYTPVLLTVVRAIPGAALPFMLVFILILIAKFLAIKTLFGCGAGQNLAILALPYVAGLILLLALLLFAAAFGLNQVPLVDDILRTLRLTRALQG